MATAQMRQHWVAIAQGMQADIQGYEQLRLLLKAQFHAALRHDATAMEQVALQIAAQAQLLGQSTEGRVLHVRALLGSGQHVSMSAVFMQLKAPLQQQMQALWAQLEALVQECKAMNLRNCQLIMEQAELMRQVVGGSAQQEMIYGPR